MQKQERILYNHKTRSAQKFQCNGDVAYFSGAGVIVFPVHLGAQKVEYGESGENNDVDDGCGLSFALSDADGALGCASCENTAKN